MPGDRDPQNLESKLDALAREVRLCRWLLIGIATVLALMLFAPRLTAAISETSQRALDFVGEYGGGVIAGLAALVFAFLAGAYIVARLNPRPPQVERPRGV